jgi:MYXO-CTERM domain-containing protein
MVAARSMTTRNRAAWMRPRALLFAGVMLSSSVAQAQYINLPGTQPGGLADGAPLDNARACGVTCHFSRDATMPSTMPYDGWTGSMMGNTMRDPLFLAALTVAEQDVPGAGDYCLRCHTPPGFVGGRTRSSAAAARGADLESADLDGVTCDSCHRMVATPNLGNGQYVFSPTETRFGPYPVIESIRHPGEASTWTADSRLCGTCHEVTNPAQPHRLADGTDTGRRFPLDTTYSEWSRSAFAVAGSPDAATCQDCHMPRAGAPGFVSTNSSAMMRENPRRHDFNGANAWALRVLAAMRNDVASGEFYDPDAVPFYEAGARRAEATLRTAVSLELRSAPTRAEPGDRIELVARITNRTGHRVPTGYTDGRRVWLEVAIVDSANRATVLSGAYDAAEAHLDTTDTQLRVYESLQGRIGVGHEEHIALHDTIIRDTRIPPRGYHPLPGHEPVGIDYSGGEGGALRHWDDARYSITLPASVRGPATLRVRARYQTTTREYVEFLASENHTDDRGRELLRRYNASGRAAPFDMAEATAPIMVGDVIPDAGVVVDGGAVVDGGGVVDSGAGVDGGSMDASVNPAQAGGGCSCHTAGDARTTTRGGGAALLLGLAAALSSRRRRRSGESRPQ